jgi:nitroimidazol reductase NimA-like FMN-containing flavoprotein (pyridoxamine 5'-phosphate oxidase superfamily)
MSFHRKWVDPEITDVELMKLILAKTTHLTIAISDGVEPYAVPLSHVYDKEENAVYFHCASAGKKMEILRKNPRVWCIAVIDQWFGPGICQNIYASIMFSGEATFPPNVEEKMSALRKQIIRNGGDVDGALNRLEAIVNQSETIKGMTVGRISVGLMTGKRSTNLSEEKLREILNK